ncbi:MAG TPA: LmeA family phospholipid-binding protein [Solirubrobacteraceae bacterium]|nr:LmeA family phospholipid-binding protein [Solirubrobacteraceae bacterium]
MRIGLAGVVVMAAVLLLLLVLAQVLLPGIAASRVRERVQPYGHVRSVSVSAFPAVKLLWGDADSVSVSAVSLSATPAQIGSLLWEARSLDELRLSAQTAVLRPSQLPAGLTLSDVHLRKRASSLSATAILTQEQLEAALPSGFSVEPFAASGGAVEAHASGALFGVQASVTVAIRAVEGDLIAEPQGLPFAGLARVTLFSDPHLKVGGVSLRISGSGPRVYSLYVWASLV